MPAPAILLLDDGELDDIRSPSSAVL